MDNSVLTGLKERMEGAVAVLKKEFSGLRTGRASADLLMPVMVDAYGSKMPLNQVSNISVADARLLSVQIWDKGMVASVEKAIRESGLGLNPTVDGDVVRISLPELNEERRQELVKTARKYAENARVSVRNVRRDGMDSVKKAEKDGDISEDDGRGWSDKVQKLTDEVIAEIDKALEHKESDIMTV